MEEHASRAHTPDQLVDELAKRIEPNLFEALRTMVDQRLAHESQTRGNVFDARAPNFRSRKESLTASNGKYNLSSARPWDLWESRENIFHDSNSHSNSNSFDRDKKNSIFPSPSRVTTRKKSHTLSD